MNGYTRTEVRHELQMTEHGPEMVRVIQRRWIQIPD